MGIEKLTESAPKTTNTDTEQSTEKQSIQSSEEESSPSSSTSEKLTSSSTTSTTPNIPRGARKPMKPAELLLISQLQSVESAPVTELEPASGQDLALGPLNAQPMIVVPPS